MNKESIFNSELDEGLYKNPILYTDYSDPDVIRVKDTYYITASSFNFVPGLPILKSYDLVNWRLINYAVNEIPYEDYNSPAHARGIWAPSIRYHDNKFWIFVGMPDEGIFMTYSEDPSKEWSKLKCIKKVKGFIDPCPIWDEDGKGYIVHAYAKSRIGFKSKLGIFEMSTDNKQAISEDKFIFDGTITQPTIEGPKIYRRNGYYFIFAPAGGVTKGWQTVLRSKNIYGPYEEKIVMHQGDTDINGPHQGGLVDTESGEEWFIHFQDRGSYGRVVHMQPVEWKNDNWPIIGVDINDDGIGEPVHSYNKPTIANKLEKIEEFKQSDDFIDGHYNLNWQFHANYKDNFYTSREGKNGLILNNINTTNYENPSVWDSANILTQKIIGPEFSATTKIDYANMKKNTRAGLLLLASEYAAITIEKNQDLTTNIVYLESESLDGKRDSKKVENIMQRENYYNTENIIYFKFNFYKDETCRFYYSIDNNKWIEFGKVFSASKATWVGARLGIFTLSKDKNEKESYAEFSYVKVDNIKMER